MKLSPLPYTYIYRYINTYVTEKEGNRLMQPHITTSYKLTDTYILLCLIYQIMCGLRYIPWYDNIIRRDGLVLLILSL